MYLIQIFKNYVNGLIFFVLLGTLYFMFPKIATAACYPPDDLGTCGSGVQCVTNGICASTLSECSQCLSQSLSCNWAVINNPQSPANNHLGFCVGGFNSPQEANQYRFSLGCNYSLEACGWATQTSLWSNMSDLPLPQVYPDGQGKYFTCITGPNGSEFESILKEMGHDSVVNSSAQCIVLGGVAGVGLFLSSGGYAGVGAVVGGVSLAALKGVIVGTVCQPLISLLGGFTPNITGTISGPSQCQANLPVKYDFSTDSITQTSPVPGSELGTTQICNFISDSGERGLCNECFTRPGVWTPFGCIETDPQKFVEKILKIAIGIAGGIAFLMIVYGGFVTMMSSGNPEKLTEGREIITSAIAGLLLIVFSVVILKIIGVDILGIPGLG